MLIKNLIEDLKELPQDWTVCLSRAFVIDDKAEITVVLDFPLAGIATNEADKEVRICIGSNNKAEIEKMFGEFIVKNEEKKSSPRKRRVDKRAARGKLNAKEARP